MEILSMGEKIKRKRKEIGMTLKDLAGNRITPGQISLVESGKSNPSMDLLEYLAERLNTSVEYLIESEEKQAEKNCTYFENIAESYIINDYLIQAEEYTDRALYYAEKYNLDSKRAKDIFLKGKIYMVKKEYPLAQQYFLSANVIFIKNNQYDQIINTFIYMGKITMILKSYQSSCNYFKQAEEVYNNCNFGNDFLIGKIYYYMASVYFKLEDIEKAISYSYLAKEKFKQVNNNSEYAKVVFLMADEYNKKGDLNNAIKYSRKALDMYKSINDLGNTAKIENNLGKLFYEFDNIEESFIHLNKSKELRIKIKDPDIIETLKNICENYIKLKDIENAKKILHEILDKIQKSDDKLLIQYYLLKYRIEILEDNKKQAENTLIDALKYADNMNFVEESGEIAILVGKFYIENGDSNKAAKYLSRGVDALKKLGIIK